MVVDPPDVLGAVWRRVRRTAVPHCVIVTGSDDATGRLVAGALPRLDPPPGATVSGTASATAPYHWLADVLRRHDPTALAEAIPGDGPRPAVITDALAWLARSGPTAPRRLEPSALQRAALRIVRHLLGDGTVPAVTVVTRLHRLDPASAALLAQLADCRLPVLLILTGRRPDASGVATATARLLKHLEENRTVTRVAAAEPVGAGTADPVAEADWARFCRSLGRRRAATAAALRAAAAWLDLDEPERANRLLAEFRQDGVGVLLGESGSEVSMSAARPTSGGTGPGGSVCPVGSGSDRLVPVRRDITGSAYCPGGELTAREREVLACLASGMSNRQVARSLGISVRTVGVHVSNLLRKTGTGSRTEAALWAVQHGHG